MKQAFTLLTLSMKSLVKFTIRKTAFLTLCSSILLFSMNIKAQEKDSLLRRNGLSLQLGGNSFFGDLGGNSGTGKSFIKDLNLKSVRLFTGLSYNYFFDKGFSLNGDIHFTSVSGADSLSDQTPGHSLGRYERNLSFKSFVYEMQITAELYP